MRIVYFMLDKYKRLMLSNIHRFELTPTSTMQLIIGSNGAGKSSLIEELTPLPAHHSYFAKGGGKKIVVEDREVTYTLDSVYEKGSGHHSFMRGTEELNNGGTFAIQKELVEEHFGLTREIHELLIGLTPFTGMSTAKRREWLTKLTPTDMRYAFNVYNKVKSHHRDQLGVIKHLTKRMARENQDLPDDSEIAHLRETVKQLTSRLDTLFQKRQVDTPPAFFNQDALQRTVTTLTQKAKRALTQRVVVPSEWGVTSSDALFAAIEDTRQQYQRQHATLERMQEEHQQLIQQAPAKDQQLSTADIEALRQKTHDVEQAYRTQQANVNHYQGLFPLVTLPVDRNPRDTLTSVFNTWMELIQVFPDNSDGRFSQEKGQHAKERLEKNRSLYRGNEGKLDGVLRRLARLKGCETVECPKCNHTFQPGVSEKDIAGLEAAKQTHQQDMAQLDVLIKQDSEYVEAYDDYVSYVNQFRRLVRDTPSLQAVWDVCLDKKVMFRHPQDFRNDVIAWHTGMEALITLNEQEVELSTLKHRLRYVDAIDQQALTQHDQRLKALEAEIEAKTDVVKQTQVTLRQQEDCYQRMIALRTTLDNLCQEYQTLFDDLNVQQNHYFQQALADESQHLQLRLAQTQERLSKVELREGVLNDLQAQHDEADQTHKDLGVLVKALAPTDGLIGRYLMGFMQNVVRMINAVISEIWTYPMEVLPSSMEKDELNYKFPLEVNNGAVTAPDIGRGSSSQRDIVNFAFKLLVMKFLRLEDMPLYLDEFGSTFDEQHRLNLIPFINQMIEMNQINQIFFISHFSATHGAFNHADVCVLDPSNITVPQTYNEHVVIT